MPRFTRDDESVYWAVEKERPEYLAPPSCNTTLSWIKVGELNHNFATYSGPQRNRPEDSPAYRGALYQRSRMYGNFSWALLSPRVVSERGNGVLYPLDGNGSNHWLERLFGPDFEVPCTVLAGLTLKEEKDIFLKLQERKKVTPTEKYRVETEYDETSLAAGIKRVVEKLGFSVSQKTTDPAAIGRTTCEWIVRRFKATGVQTGLNALALNLECVMQVFPSDDPKRTNGALVKALAIILHDDDEFPAGKRDEVLGFIGEQGAAEIVRESRGGGGEQEVLRRLHDALGY